MRLQPSEIWTPARWTDPDIELDLSDGDLCIKIANLAFSTLPTPICLDEWQCFVIRLALSRDKATGERLYSQFLVSLGRQNGKSTLATALVLYDLITRADANVIGIASSRDQADLVYRMARNVINHNGHLKKRFLKTNEIRGLHTVSGGRYSMMPSKNAALQGHTITLGLIDEVHLLKSDLYQAMVLGAGQPKDALVFCITTAGDEDSTLLLDLYDLIDQAAEGFGGCIWEADEGASVSDLEQLKKANPGLAEGRMNPKKVLQEVSVIPEPEARRYRLNRFIAAENAWLPINAWSKLPRLGDEQPLSPVLVLDKTPDWSAATITINWKHQERLYTDVVASLVNPKLQDLVDLCEQVTDQLAYDTLYMDTQGLGECADILKGKGLAVEKYVYRDVLNAPAAVYPKIIEGLVTHGHQPMVEYQLARTKTKEVGEARKLIRLNPSVEIDASISTVMGLYFAEIQQDIPLQIF